MIPALVYFLFAWQQRVSYDISADLDPQTHTLTAVENLTYYNNSPAILETLYFHLYPNAFQDRNTVFAREIKMIGDYKFERAPKKDRGYIRIDGVQSGERTVRYEVNETIMRLILDQPLLPGDSLGIRIDFFLKIPKIYSRFGYTGRHYEMVQWYPKPCVYDETGWHNDAFHALGEFYGEFGDFSVTIRLPGEFVVCASGVRTDEADSAFIDHLIRDGNKPVEVPVKKTVSFWAENVHDFAWVADPDFLVRRIPGEGLNIECYYHRKSEKSWRRAGEYARDAVRMFSQWYGSYPYPNLSIVEGRMTGGGGMEYPNLVVIATSDNFLLNFFETAIVHEIGHQWFYGVLGSDEMDETWLDEGLTSYAETRYYETKYGSENSLLKSKLLPPLTVRYYNQVLYYLAQTNGFDLTPLRPAYDFTSEPAAYAVAAYTKPALFLNHLAGIMGQEKFDAVMRNYYERYRFRHPHTADFVAVCNEQTGQDWRSVFDSFLGTDVYSDWRIKRVDANTVEFANGGGLILPVDVYVETDQGGGVYRLSADTTVIQVAGGRKIRRVTIDPAGYAWETDYWNNHYPKKFAIKPIFAYPSLDEYQVFVIPYLWFGTVDGFTPGLYLAGARFVDFDVVKGRHQWLLGGNYGLRSRRIFANAYYQTPIYFQRGARVRVVFSGGLSHESKFSLGLSGNFGIPFTNRPAWSAVSYLNHYHIDPQAVADSQAPFDDRDWDPGNNLVWENAVGFKHQSWHVAAEFSLAQKFLGGDWNYFKTDWEVKKTLSLLLPINLRIFAGWIEGRAPRQDQLFLNGKLRITQIANLIFSQSGDYSPQERIHIPGDGNMRGFQTLHIKTDRIFCVNFELPARWPIKLFGDYGYYRAVGTGSFTTVYDLGFRVVLGPVSFNLPVYANQEKVWSARWTIGF
jgi:hypothetical protein